MESEAGTNDGCALGHCSTAVSPTPLQLCQIGVSARSPEQLGGSGLGGWGGGVAVENCGQQSPESFFFFFCHHLDGSKISTNQSSCHKG